MSGFTVANNEKLSLFWINCMAIAWAWFNAICLWRESKRPMRSDTVYFVQMSISRFVGNSTHSYRKCSTMQAWIRMHQINSVCFNYLGREHHRPVFLNWVGTPSHGGINKFPRVASPSVLYNMESLIDEFTNKCICFYNLFDVRVLETKNDCLKWAWYRNG